MCLHVKQGRQRRRWRKHREAACANESGGALCAWGMWLCMCAFELFSPASRQRSERGQELIAATFFLSPSIHLYTLHPPAPFPPPLRPPPSLQSSSFILPVLINRNLVTKGFPHATHVPSIIGKPWGKNIDPIKYWHWNLVCVCVCVWTLSSKPLNCGSLKGSFKGICSSNEPLKLMRCVYVYVCVCACVCVTLKKSVCGWECRDFVILLGGCSRFSPSHEALL